MEFAHNVKIHCGSSVENGFSTNQRPILARIFFNDFPRKNRRFDMLWRKAFFQKMVVGMSFYKVITLSHMILNRSDIHAILPRPVTQYSIPGYR